MTAFIHKDLYSFLCLEEDGKHSSGMGYEGNPFSGWVTVQAGMQRLCGQESKYQRAQPGPSGQGILLGEGGLGFVSLDQHPLHGK